MRIIAPVDHLAEAEQLLEAGAEELAPADFSARARQSCLARFGQPCSPNTCYYPEYYGGE